MDEVRTRANSSSGFLKATEQKHAAWVATCKPGTNTRHTKVGPVQVQYDYVVTRGRDNPANNKGALLLSDKLGQCESVGKPQANEPQVGLALRKTNWKIASVLCMVLNLFANLNKCCLILKSSASNSKG